MNRLIGKFVLAAALLFSSLGFTQAVQAMQMSSSPIVMNGGRLMVTVDNWSRAALGVQVIVLDTNSTSNQFKVVARTDVTPVPASHDSFFDIFVDAGECRYRVVVITTNPQGVIEVVNASVQVQDVDGATTMHVDSFFDIDVSAMGLN